MFLASKKLEGTNTKGGDLSFECLLPLDVYWAMEKLFKDLEYLTASGEDQVQALELTHKIMKKIATYVVSEKERVVLKELIHGKSA